MTRIDYSLYYSRFHDDSEDHARSMATHFKALLKDDLPADRTARILDIGCGYGFALRALRDLGYSELVGLETSHQQAQSCHAQGIADDSVAAAVGADHATVREHAPRVNR